MQLFASQVVIKYNRITRPFFNCLPSAPQQLQLHRPGSNLVEALYTAPSTSKHAPSLFTLIIGRSRCPISTRIATVNRALATRRAKYDGGCLICIGTDRLNDSWRRADVDSSRPELIRLGSPADAAGPPRSSAARDFYLKSVACGKESCPLAGQ